MTTARVWLIVLLATACASRGAPDSRSEQPCGAGDERALLVLKKIRYMAADTVYPWPEARDSLQLPFAPPDQVTLETDRDVCTRAAAAYDAELLRIGGEPSTTRRIVVVRVATHVFVVDMNEAVGEWRTGVLFDHEFRALSRWGI